MSANVRPREVRFPARVDWEGGRRTVARVDGKEALRIAPPPEFQGTDPEIWSPEDAFVVAAASCLAVTLTGRAQREEVPLHDLSVEATGVVGRRPDGRFGFVRIEQRVALATDPEHAEAARRLVARAEKTCLVAVSLDVELETTVEVRTTAGAPGGTS